MIDPGGLYSLGDVHRIYGQEGSNLLLASKIPPVEDRYALQAGKSPKAAWYRGRRLMELMRHLPQPKQMEALNQSFRIERRANPETPDKPLTIFLPTAHQPHMARRLTEDEARNVVMTGAKELGLIVLTPGDDRLASEACDWRDQEIPPVPEIPEPIILPGPGLPDRDVIPITEARCFVEVGSGKTEFGTIKEKP